MARPLGPGVERGTAKGCEGPDTRTGRLGLVAYRWRRRAAGCGRASKEAREDTEHEPAAASETVRGLPRRYLSEAGRARGPAARAAPEHVHIWRSFRTPGAHWPAREGHVGPRARTAPNRPARAAPGRPRPPDWDPALTGARVGWVGAPGGLQGWSRRRPGADLGAPPRDCRAPWGRARLHPETAWPGAGRHPEQGVYPRPGRAGGLSSPRPL